VAIRGSGHVLQMIKYGISAFHKIKKGSMERTVIHYSTMTLGSKIVATLTMNDPYWQRKIYDEASWTC